MRLFIALWPPAQAVDELTLAAAGARALAPDLRWVPAQQWHLTLAFLGEVADQRRPELTRRLARAAARHPPLRLRFADAGRFGDRVLLMKVAGDREPLRDLAASVTAAAGRAGLAVEDRPYRPHLTLARSSRGADLRPLVAALRSYCGVDWTATHLQLVHSRPGSAPARATEYETVEAWPLTGQARTSPALDRSSGRRLTGGESGTPC
jgi:2'-5' RNA ligase